MKFFAFLTFLIFLPYLADSQARFVTSNGKNFYISNSEYRYFGVNYWYGGFLATSDSGKKRLQSELDFLQQVGVNNLRVMISAEGDSTYPYRIYPSLQVKPRKYNESLLRSFDYFLVEASKRNMRIVFVLSNNWEWSGGFGTYLEWAKRPNPILPKTKNWDWDKYSQYISKFYSCDSCQKWYLAWIKKVLLRKNTLTNTMYKDDTTIMSWELANEPRPMKLSEIRRFKTWIQISSNYLRFWDKNHLISIGSEGIIGTAMDSNLFQEIHTYPSIDYATIHIWPKTWQWYSDEFTSTVSDTTLEKTKNYIINHMRWARAIKRPLVIEEFGMHRDHQFLEETTNVKNRNKYFNYVFEVGNEYGVSGYNFWGAFAHRDLRLKGDFWRKGLPYTADPPQEEQGLYGIYMSDTYTWGIIALKNRLLQILSEGKR